MEKITYDYVIGLKTVCGECKRRVDIVKSGNSAVMISRHFNLDNKGFCVMSLGPTSLRDNMRDAKKHPSQPTVETIKRKR